MPRHNVLWFFVVRYIRYVVTNEQIFPVEKIIKKGLKIYEIKNNQINYDDFDEYEKIMIQELIELL